MGMIGGFISGGAGTGKAKVDAQDNVILGRSAGLLLSDDDDDNIAIGYLALMSTTTSADNNVAVGREALKGVTTGDYNVGMGTQAGFNLTEGKENVCVGYKAGYDIDIGSYNTFIGSRAGLYTEAASADEGYNVGIGYYTLRGNEEGQFNTSIGALALYGNTTDDLTGITGIGYKAGYALRDTGTGCTFIGYEAGITKTSSSNCTMIGYEAGKSASATAADQVFIGFQTGESCDASNVVAIGNNAVPDGQNDNRIGSYGAFQFGSNFMDVAHSHDTADTWADTTPCFYLPAGGIVFRITVCVTRLSSNSDAKFAIWMGTSALQVVDTAASATSAFEILGAGEASTKSWNDKDPSDIDAGAGAQLNACWTSEPIDKLDGVSAILRLAFVANADDNGTSSPTTAPQLRIFVQYSAV